MPRTKEFDLHFGCEDKDGIHKHVVMRAVTNGDIIATAKDHRIKELLKQDYSIDMAAAAALSQGKGVDDVAIISGMKLDPIKLQASQGAIAELYGIIFARVIISIGSITRIDTKTFSDMSPTDFAIIQKHYQELNAVDEDLLKGDAPEADPSQQEESA